MSNSKWIRISCSAWTCHRNTFQLLDKQKIESEITSSNWVSIPLEFFLNFLFVSELYVIWFKWFSLNIYFENDPPYMIGLKAKSENKIDLCYDINLLYTLKLMPEAVLNSFSQLLFPLPLHVLSAPFITACSGDVRLY